MIVGGCVCGSCKSCKPEPQTVVIHNVFTSKYDSYKINPFTGKVIPYNRGENK